MMLVVWNETARTAGAFYMCVATFGSYVFREKFPAKTKPSVSQVYAVSKSRDNNFL